jgi:hypothetical protein
MRLPVVHPKYTLSNCDADWALMGAHLYRQVWQRRPQRQLGRKVTKLHKACGEAVDRPARIGDPLEPLPRR